MKFTEQEARQSFLELLRIPSVTGTAGEEQACAYLEGILDRFGIAHRRICRDPKRPNLLAKLTAVNPTEDPMILISHIDVVSGDPEKWTHGLFSADCEGVHLGAYVETKNSNFARGNTVSHLTYIGDSDVGKYCNFGCGTVTCNYDGKDKFRTQIGVSMYVIIALLGCVAAVLGIYGDLFASVVKRQCGIKDYGTSFLVFALHLG